MSKKQPAEEFRIGAVKQVTDALARRDANWAGVPEQGRLRLLPAVASLSR